jgi:hypothetical protein
VNDRIVDCILGCLLVPQESCGEAVGSFKTLLGELLERATARLQR